MDLNENRPLCPDVTTGVVLFHGLTGMPSEMRPVAKHLTKLGCKVECPLLPGHGAGHKELLATGWKDWVAGAKQSLENFAKECDHVVVGGLSMGALLALLCALEEPKVSGVVLLSPTLHYDSRNSNTWKQHMLFLIDFLPFLGDWFWWTEEPPYGLKDERLQRIITKSIEAAQRGESTDFGNFRTYSGSLRQLHHLVAATRKQARRLAVPALIMHSMEDSLTSIKNATEMCDLMTSNEKTLIILSGCDHVLTLDLRKRDVANYVGNFVIKASWDQQQRSKKLTTSSSV